MIVVDEAAFVEVKSYREVLLPVAQGSGIIIIGLTTPLGQDNPTTRFFDTKDDSQQTIWRQIRIGQPCQSCKEKKVLCHHNENATGTGLSKRKRRQYMHFYADVMHIAMREYQGTPGEGGERIFTKESLESLIRRNPHPIGISAQTSFVVLSIDPAQGGKCAWGLCACYYDTAANLQVILHLDAVHLDVSSPDHFNEHIRLTILSIRNRHRCLEQVPIVIACESAPKIVCLQLALYIQMIETDHHIQGVYLMYEMGNDSAGVPKTNLNTQQMVAYTQLLLENDQVAFSDKFDTRTPNMHIDRCVSIKQQLVAQLNNFQRREIASIRLDGIPHYRIDGKAGSQDDDLGVAYIMNVQWYITIVSSLGQKYHHVTGGSKRCVRPGQRSATNNDIREKRSQYNSFLSDDPVSTAELQSSTTATQITKRARISRFSERLPLN